MNNFLDYLTVLKGLENDRLISAFAHASQSDQDFRKFLRELYAAGAETDLSKYIYNAVLHDENAFTVCCAKGITPSPYLVSAYCNDLSAIAQSIENFNEQDYCLKGIAPYPFGEDNNQSIRILENYYRTSGYGIYIDNRAFAYENGSLVPIRNVSAITLDELKDYTDEKRAVQDNIQNFLSNLPYSNMLLYGDRGTGKSSTVHAMLNAYYTDGLRLIDLDKTKLSAIPAICGMLADNPLKFIIFIDDLSLNENEQGLSTLKTYLEGSVSACGANMMIIVTSNRRHIVKENFADRQESVHPADSIAEQLSLSDRFGLTVLFSSTDKATYLDIIAQLADDRNLLCNRNELINLAERWAILKGGRSPRRAKQFIDYVYSCEKRGLNVQF